MNIPHQIQRYKERYGKFLTTDDYCKMEVLAKKSPQLKFTNIRSFEWDNTKVYVYIKGNRIASFLTEQQAFRSQDIEFNKHNQPPVTFNKVFNIGKLIKI